VAAAEAGDHARTTVAAKGPVPILGQSGESHGGPTIRARRARQRSTGRRRCSTPRTLQYRKTRSRLSTQATKLHCRHECNIFITPCWIASSMADMSPSTAPRQPLDSPSTAPRQPLDSCVHPEYFSHKHSESKNFSTPLPKKILLYFLPGNLFWVYLVKCLFGNDFCHKADRAIASWVYARLPRPSNFLPQLVKLPAAPVKLPARRSYRPRPRRGRIGLRRQGSTFWVYTDWPATPVKLAATLGRVDRSSGGVAGYPLDAVLIQL
jgi:hypothetical protein